jgi:peptidoglycan hydrolase-like protein with peptidoglycan-binding domain
LARKRRSAANRRNAGATGGVIARFADRAFEHPATSGGLLVMAMTAAAIASNAMFLQQSRHPGPLFTTRPPPSASVSPPAVDVPLPRSRSAHAPPAAGPEPSLDPGPATASPPSPPDIRLVIGLQQELTRRGLYRGAIDGLAGPQTSAAIRAAEAAEGLPQTGIPTAELLAALTRPAPKAALPPAPKIKTVPSGPDPVALERARYRRIQAALNLMGYGPLKVDGEAGEDTANAIRRFELDQGLPINGAISDRLINRLVSIGAMSAI